MKALTILFVSIVSILAQSPPPAHRLLGTNIVDFTWVLRELANPNSAVDWHRKYIAAGKVEKVSAGGLIALAQTRKVYEYNTDSVSGQLTRQYGGGSDMLGMMAAARLGQNGPISAGHYFSLSPNLRQYFNEVNLKTVVTVRGYEQPTFVGQSLELVAWPVGVNTFDYGTPVAGNLGDKARFVLNVGPNGVTTSRAASTADLKQSEAVAFERQRIAATNGSGSAQYEVGKRYLTAEEFELARHWLMAAKTNGYAQAADRLLEKIKPSSALPGK